MASINKVILIGYLGADPDMRYTPSGTAVANFNMATTEQWTDKDGERKERTEWHRVVVWRKLAETCGKYLHKGSLVYIDGRLQTRTWEDRDGNKRWTTEIIAQGMQMLDRAGRTADAESFGEEFPQEVPSNVPEDDIPF